MIGRLIQRQSRIFYFLSIIPAFLCPCMSMNVIEHTLVSIFVNTCSAYYCRHFVNSLEQYTEFQSFVLESSREIVTLAGKIRISDRCHILFVNHFITIQVLIDKVTKARSSESISQSTSFQFLFEVEHSVAIAIIDEISPYLS